MKRLTGFMIILFLSSCVTSKKVERYLNENKEFAANYCADEFPVKESVKVDTLIDTLTLNQYIERIQEIRIHDTIQGRERIIEAVKLQFRDKLIQSPPKQVVKTIVKENTAKIAALTEENKRINSELYYFKRQNAGLKTFRSLTIVFSFLFLLLVAVYFWGRKNKLFP